MLVEVEREPLSAHAEAALERFHEEFLTGYLEELAQIAEAFPDLKARVETIREHLQGEKFAEAARESLRKAYRCGRVHELHASNTNKDIIEILDDYNQERNRLWEKLRQDVKRKKT